MINNGLKLIQ